MQPYTMPHHYVIIDDNPASAKETLNLAGQFPQLHFAGSANNYDEALDLILERQPALVFLEIDPEDPQSRLSLALVSELYRYLTVMPEIIVTTHGKDFTYDALRFEVLDYVLKPLQLRDLRRSIMRFDKKMALLGAASPAVPAAVLETPVIMEPVVAPTQDKVEIAAEVKELMEEVHEHTNGALAETEEAQDTVIQPTEDKPLIICVKSYGDYRFIEARDICYLQADNNSTDIHLFNGEMVTAFKTLKHFENVLTSPFVRIHNSYIVNIDYVSRIHTGNSVCYIKNSTTKLPFSKSYKENVDTIISSITNGNYLEI